MTVRDHRGPALALFHRAFEPLLAVGRRYPALEEIIVDGPNKLLVAAEEGLVSLDLLAETGLGPPEIRALCDTAAVVDGSQFGEVPPARPTLSVKIPPELRVSAAIPPVADEIGVNIRFLRGQALTLEDYVAQGVMTEDQAAHLRQLLHARKSMVIAGGTGTGKTTLLRALLREVAGHQRLLIIEDVQELALDGFNPVHLRTTPGVSLADLLQHAMRRRPDRIVVGEVRGPEALGAMIAMNSGHDGTLLTLHANRLEEALAKLHTLGSMGWAGLPFEWVQRAVDGVVHLEGRGRHRRLRSIWEVPHEGHRADRHRQLDRRHDAGSA
jgi:type IV secretion system protein VirB11